MTGLDKNKIRPYPCLSTPVQTEGGAGGLALPPQGGGNQRGSSNKEERSFVIESEEKDK